MTKSNLQFLCVLFVALLAVAGTWQFAGAQAEKVALGVKWEYTSLNASDTTVTRANLLGKDGWELVAVETAPKGDRPALLYFKRAK